MNRAICPSRGPTASIVAAPTCGNSRATALSNVVASQSQMDGRPRASSARSSARNASIALFCAMDERLATSLRTYALAKSRTRSDSGCPPSFSFLEKYRRIVPWLAPRSPEARQCAVTSQQSRSKSRSTPNATTSLRACAMYAARFCSADTLDSGSKVCAVNCAPRYLHGNGRQHPLPQEWSGR